MAGLATSFGSGAMTNSIEEISDSKVLFVIGSNPTEAHPIIGAKMKQALSKGAKLVVVDPRKTKMAELADVWLRVRPGTDVLLANGLAHIILKNGWEDQEFIDNRTEGFEEFRRHLEKFTPKVVSNVTGIPEEQLLEAARIYATAEGAQIFYTLGITEHVNGTDNVMCLANLAMLTGNVGKENSGVNPLRGQNNVQGACDMGALPNVYPGYQNVKDPAIKAKFEIAWQVTLDDKPGFMIPDMFKAAIDKSIRGMYILGEDPVLTDADANHIRAGLEAFDFLVVQELFLSETAKLADVILPGASFAEKTGTFTNTERRVQMVNQAIQPIGNSKTDEEIICELAKRMGAGDLFEYKNSAEIMSEIASLTPQYAGITHARLGNKGLLWPVPSADHPGTKFLHQGKFTRGKGCFQSIEHTPPAEMPNEAFPLLLSTGRKLEHYNVMSQNSAALDSYSPEELAELNPLDAEKLHISDGERVKVSSRRGVLETKVKVTDRVPPGIFFMTLHYKESPTNVLTNGAYDKVTKTYEYKVCGVKVEKI